MDESPSTPVVTPEDMERRAQSTEDYWRSLLTFRADAAEDQRLALEKIDQQEQFGSIDPEAAESARAAIRQDYESRLSEIESGPTAELLQSEFQAQRTFAEERHTRQNPPETGKVVTFGPEAGNTGPARMTLRGLNWVPPVGGDIQAPGYWQDARGNKVGKGRRVISVADPAPPPAFQFAENMGEYYSNLFGTEAGPSVNLGRPSAPQATRRRAGGSEEQGIGVGEVYSWY